MVTAKVLPLKRRSPRFGNILVPVDGSPFSMAAALKAIDFARRMDARLIVFHSIPLYQYPIYLGGIPFEYPSEADYEAQCRTIAQRYVDLVASAATTQGVVVSTRIEFDPEPAQAIVDLARRESCELIYLGSHGRSGLSRIFLGSVALKTLTLSHIPVLLDRPEPDDVARAQTLMNQNAIEP